MKNKKVISVLLTFIMLFGVFSLPVSAQAVNVEKKSIMQYCSKNFTFKKSEDVNYKCTVTGNSKKYVTVEHDNEGDYYWLYVRAKKVTPENAKVNINVYKETNGQKTYVKKLQITVKKAKTVKMNNIKINVKTGKEIKLKNPYDLEYKFKYNKKGIKITQSLYSGEDAYYILKGLKKGTYTVKAYLSGTKKKIGTFKVSVGDYKAGIKKKYANVTIYYNSHMDTHYLQKGSVDLSQAISNYHSNSTYTVKLSNSTLAGTNTVKKTDITPKAVLLYSKKTGKTKITVYEKRGKAKKKKIGTINLTVKKASDAKVFYSNMEFDNDGIFYENFISPGEKYDLKSEVVRRYINYETTKSHFNENEYKFSAVSNNSIITFDENGVATCNALDKDGTNRINYTVTFSDGSKAYGSGAFDIWELEDRPD